jgi:hypothetical protein
VNAAALDAIRTPLSHSGLWCGEATLESFGITVRGLRETCWAAVATQLQHDGWQLDWEIAPWAGENNEGHPTLSRFIADRPEGDYLIFTADHIMSLRDGKLTDTDLASGGRRRVIMAYRVSC